MRKRTRKRKSAPVDNGVWTSLSPEEEEKKIIEMLDAHVPQAEIARKFKRNINFINGINKKRQQTLKPRDKSAASRAFKLFKEGMDVLDVAIELGIEAPEAEVYLVQYWRLRASDDFSALYNDLGSRLGEFIAAFKEMSSKGITVDQAIEIKNLSSKVHELRSHYGSLTSEIARLSTEIPQMRERRDSLTNQLGNVNSELKNRMAINVQLKHEYNDLNSMPSKETLRSKKLNKLPKKRGDQLCHLGLNKCLPH
jgi:soluble cytochrome b562/archaellum component FlaC